MRAVLSEGLYNGPNQNHSATTGQLNLTHEAQDLEKRSSTFLSNLEMEHLARFLLNRFSQLIDSNGWQE
jgi:hypothetical protein